MTPGKLTLSVTFVLQPLEFPVVKQLNCLLSADYAHNVSMSDSEFGTNGSDRGKSPRRPHRWALEKNCRGEIVFFLNLPASFFPIVSLLRSHLSVPKHSTWRQPLHDRPVGQHWRKWHLVRAVVEQNQHRPALPHHPAAAAAVLPLGLLLRQVHLLG